MPDDMRNVWRNQELDAMTITLEDIRARAGRFRHRLLRRNAREYITGAVCLAIFTPGLWMAQGWHRVAPALLIGGLIVLLYQVHRQAAPGQLVVDGLRASVARYRRELERQRDALRNVWLWYELPLVPGVAASCIDTAWTRGVNARFWVAVLIMLCIFVAIWAANIWAARNLERRIEELQLLEERHD